MFWPFKRAAVQERSAHAAPAVLRGQTVVEFKEPEHAFRKIFEIELESWCYGLTKLDEAPLPQVVFRVVRELRPIIAEAIQNGYVFDIQKTAERIFNAAQGAAPQKEILFALLALLPNPEELPIEQKRMYSFIVAQVELAHGGAVERVKQRFHRGTSRNEDQPSPG